MVAFVSVTLPTNVVTFVVPGGPSKRTPCGVVVKPMPLRTNVGAGGPALASSAVRIGARSESHGDTVNASAAPDLPLMATSTSSFGPASRLVGSVIAIELSVGAGALLIETACPPTRTLGVCAGELRPEPLIVRAFATTALPATCARAPAAGDSDSRRGACQRKTFNPVEKTILPFTGVGRVGVSSISDTSYATDNR